MHGQTWTDCSTSVCWPVELNAHSSPLPITSVRLRKLQVCSANILTIDQLIDLVLLEQFRQTLPETIELLVMEHDIQTAHQGSVLAGI